MIFLQFFVRKTLQIDLAHSSTNRLEAARSKEEKDTKRNRERKTNNKGRTRGMERSDKR